MKAKTWSAILCVSLLISLFTYAATDANRGKTSPHADALALVLETQTDVIAKVDTENWWHDTKERSWTVVRPFGPGIINSTQMFNVFYKIDGKAVASWSVDTGKKTVTKGALSNNEPKKTNKSPDDVRQIAKWFLDLFNDRTKLISMPVSMI